MPQFILGIVIMGLVAGCLVAILRSDRRKREAAEGRATVVVGDGSSVDAGPSHHAHPHDSGGHGGGGHGGGGHGGGDGGGGHGGGDGGGGSH